MHPETFFKITQGNNGGYQCNADGSYSCVCGIGVINANQFLSATHPGLGTSA
jgi:hypothetical protein